MYISLLVSLDIQSSTIIRKANPTSSDRYSPNYQIHPQYYITSMIKFNGTLNNHQINKSYHIIKLLHHKNYHIIHITKITLVMIELLLQYITNHCTNTSKSLHYSRGMKENFNIIIKLWLHTTYEYICTNNKIKINRIFIIWCIYIIYHINNKIIINTK